MEHRANLRTAAARSRLALAGAAVWMLAGCLAVRSPRQGEPLDIGAGEALAIGRVRIFEQGRELHPWRLEGIELVLADPDLRLSLFHVESGRKRPYVAIDDDGWFEWILPAGTYLIFHTPSVEPPFNEPLAAFQLRAGREPIDLGELRLDISVDRPGLGEIAGYEVRDIATQPNEPGLVEARLARHPGSVPSRPGQLVVDPELQGLFSNWSQKACARVLARHGIELEPGVR